MKFGQIISVAVPRPIDSLFTYRLRDDLVARVAMGGYVRVPFGKSSLDAFVVEPPRLWSEQAEPMSCDALKDVIDVLDELPSLPEDVLSLCRWAHEYYAAPLGEVLSCAAPVLHAGVRKLKRPAKVVGFSGTPVLSLQLNAEQIEVVEKFDHLRRLRAGKVGLCHGVTGSGKTEVYIELARRALAEGQGVLVLVPEIALTPQLHRRFEEGLGCSVGLWHSAMSAGKRRDLYHALRSGGTRVVVGARSAVFAPVQNLGLIVVDEEHDATYKQDDGVRYQARDLAVVRGKITHSFVLLGSATPSLESLERVREGRYSLGELRCRVSSAGMPLVEIVDLKCAEKVSGTQAPLARYCVDRIQHVLDIGQQVLVYLNRRGFASYLLCADCGQVRECQNCSISLTIHRAKRQLKCHHCDHAEPIPLMCSVCQGVNLRAMGAGTESLEADLPRLVQGARIARLDRDLVTSAGRLNEILESFRKGETNLLLGTQMLVKGHDFPNVTLVVVVLADSLFRWPDFRAAERAYQILKQVAGRAGRGEKSGHVLIQTFDPEHPVLQTVAQESAELAFFENERALRHALHYPPFGRIARLRVEGPVQGDVIQSARSLSDALRREFAQEVGLNILGPSEAFLEKSHGTFRWDILLKAKEIQVLQRAIRYFKQASKNIKKRIQIDVDPYGV